MKVRKGDTVIVTTGKDRGKSGTVIRAFPKTEKILIDGINVAKRHQRSRRTGQKGQIIERAFPINVSNVALKDAKTGKATRVGFKIEDGKKIRIAKKSGAKIG
jgi:large subunit ribosomal protein L24